MTNPIQKDHEVLSVLYNLDNQLQTIQRFKGRLPEEVQEEADRLKILQKQHLALDKKHKTLQEEITAKIQANKEADKKLAKYGTQKETITNEREFNALMQQIEFEEVHKQLIEKQLYTLNKKTESQAHKLAELAERIAAVKAIFTKKEKELSVIEARYAAQTAALQQKKDKVVVDLSPTTALIYKELETYRPNATPIAHIERDACSGCHLYIPPAQQILVSAQRTILTCEHCGRILIDPAVDTEDKPTAKQ